MSATLDIRTYKQSKNLALNQAYALSQIIAQLSRNELVNHLFLHEPVAELQKKADSLVQVFEKKGRYE